MVFGKVKRILKKALTVTMAAAIVATSVPCYSVLAASTESVQTQQNEDSVAENETVEKESVAETGVDEKKTEETVAEENALAEETEETGSTETGETEETDSTETETGETETESETKSLEENLMEVVTDGVDEEKNMSLRFVVSAVSAWQDLIQQDITADFSAVTELKKDYVLSYDLFLPADADFTGNFYIKIVTKLHDGGENTWKWTDGDVADAKSIDKAAFTQDEDNNGLLKYTYSGKIGEGAEAYTGVDALVVAVGSSDSTYNGAIFVDNVKLLDGTGSVLAQQDFTGYENAVELGNMDGVDSGEGGNTEEASKVIYEQNFDALTDIAALGTGNLGTAGVDPELAEIVTGNKALKYAVDLSTSTGWKDAIQAEIQLSEAYTEAITDKVNMSFDVYVPESNLEKFGTMKAQAALKSGESWTWVTQKSWPQFTAETLETDENVSGYKKMHFSIDMNDFQKWDNDAGANVDYKFEDITPIHAVIPCLAGDTSTYVGDLYLDNIVVTAYDKENTDIPDVEGDLVLSLDASAWTPISGYQYTGENTIKNVTIGEKQYLAATLDYTKDTAQSWSEAKYDYTHPVTVESLNGYNTFKADVYYKKDNMTAGSFKLKVFMDSDSDGTGEINKDVALPEGTAVEGVAGLEGYYKSEFVLGFSAKDVSFSKLTLGIVGVNTDYKGDILLDNVCFTQIKAEDIYKDATLTAQKGVGITVSEDGRTLTTASGNAVAIASEVALVDAEAVDATKNLYAYLKAVGESDSVIFGHQNDTHHKAGATGTGYSNSDTKDVTGSIAGVVGLDTLSLTGNEALTWNATEAERIENLAQITREAAAEGAIITLSSHMPNFEVIDQRVKAFEEGGKVGNTSETFGYWENEDGTKSYNFSGYTPGTLSGDIVNRIMPGNDLNYLFTDYLDMIADYAKAVEKDGITILFRPFHENTGSWFWWGAAQCDEQAYINLYRYTVDYMKEIKGVHNMLYVYGPGSEAENVEQYAARYPGDAYVDIIGYDMYQQNPTQENEGTYLANIAKQNAILRDFAAEHNKIYAITETGVANTGAALLPSGNQVQDWYMQLLDQIYQDGGVSYFLVWANFNDTDSFYLPFVTEKKEDGTLHGHEMLDDFIAFYNDNRSVFATDMNSGYKNVQGVTNATTVDNVSGYFLSPVSGDRILGDTTFTAKISGITETAKVKVVVTTEADEVTVEASYNAEKGVWEAVLAANELLSMGKGPGTITLLVEGVEISKINALINMPEEAQNPLVPDDFESYGGSSKLLNGAWATNKASGSSIEISLTDEEEKVFGGSYALQMDISLGDKDAWAGATKNLGNSDWSAGNALELYTIPESFAQKVVVQVQSAGNIFEVYLQEYEDYTVCAKKGVPVKVTIPFSKFVGRDNKSAAFNPEQVEIIGFWCNAIASDSVTFPLDTAITYDEVKVVTTDKTEITVEAMGVVAKEGIWVDDIEPQTYTGKVIKPEPDVYDGEKLLTKGKDYTVKYKDNKDKGTAKVTIKGKGNYADEITTTFEIVAKDVTELNITAPVLIAYKEKGGKAVEQKVKVTVKDGNRTLKVGKDYALEIKNEAGEAVEKVSEAGIYTISISGDKEGLSGNYTGTISKTISVEKRTLLTNAKIKLPTSSLDYTTAAEGAMYNAEDVTVTVGGKTVPVTNESGKVNYIISYENNKNAGKNAYIVVTATADGDYAGSVKKKFTVKGEKFSAGTIQIDNFDNERDYTGKKQYQNQITLWNKAALRAAGDNAAKQQEAKLIRNVDYTISYKNNGNTDAGKVTVIMEGCGKYTGKITKTFKIKPVTLTTDMIKSKDIAVEHNKAGVTPDVSISYNGMELINGKDYTLSYKNNKNVTTENRKAVITIKGKGNYTGKLTDAVSLTIEAKSLNSDAIAITVADIQYKNGKAEYKPSVIVADNGKKLKAGKDYTVTFENNTKEAVEPKEGAFTYCVATAVITAKEGGDYCTDNAEQNVVKVDFRITANMMKDVSVTVSKAQTFAKEGVIPEKEDLVVKYKGETVDAAKYDIVPDSCVKNDRKGTATLIIKGNEEFGGTKTVKFTIEAKSFTEKITDTLSSFVEALGF